MRSSVPESCKNFLPPGKYGHLSTKFSSLYRICAMLFLKSFNQAFSRLNVGKFSHGRGEYARDEDGDGFRGCQHDGGIWSAIAFVAASSIEASQEKLPLYLGFSSGPMRQALLRSLVETPLTAPLNPY